MLRFVAFKCEIEPDGLRASYRDGTTRHLFWADVAAVTARQLPPDPPWRGMLVLDIVPGPRPHGVGPPVRLLSSTFVNFAALPEGQSTSRLENTRRLAALVCRRNPSVEMDLQTAAFVREAGACSRFGSMSQFVDYDARYG